MLKKRFASSTASETTSILPAKVFMDSSASAAVWLGLWSAASWSGRHSFRCGPRNGFFLLPSRASFFRTYAGTGRIAVTRKSSIRSSSVPRTSWLELIWPTCSHRKRRGRSSRLQKRSTRRAPPAGPSWAKGGFTDGRNCRQERGAAAAEGDVDSLSSAGAARRGNRGHFVWLLYHSGASERVRSAAAALRDQHWD